MNNTDIREAIRRQVRIVGNQSILARSWGISPQYLSDILKGRRDPGEAVLRKLGYEKRVTYAKGESK